MTGSFLGEPPVSTYVQALYDEAWGGKLGKASDAAVTAGVLNGSGRSPKWHRQAPAKTC